MNVEYVIIQAGGLGTRLGHLTANKPKGIVPVNNLPMIFHIMQQHPDKHYIIIGDYKHDVLMRYMSVFSPVKNYAVVVASEKGTAAGISDALDLVPSNKPFLLIWSDLVVDGNLHFEDMTDNTLGLSDHFTCRWSYKNDEFLEEASVKHGVAGFFVFKNKQLIEDVPQSGEFVRWLQSKKFKFNTVPLTQVNEVGTLLAYEASKDKNVCRPFNKLTVNGDKIIKEGITDQGKEIAKKEVNWYKELSKLGYSKIPKIYSYEPLVMQKINGSNPFKLDLSDEDKKLVIKNYVNALIELHSLGKCKVDKSALEENYITKTFNRIDKIRFLVPFANNEYITINGQKCKNIFYNIDEFKTLVRENLYKTNFCIIHGDCTFSNVIVDRNLNTTLIDPRGYFGKLLVYGDEYYDWAKLYYSIFGNYDQFNNKNFVLDIKDTEVSLKIDSSGYDKFKDYFISLIPNCDVKKLDILHAIIWLSLSTYAWEDYDSICGAFYNGLLYLNNIDK